MKKLIYFYGVIVFIISLSSCSGNLPEIEPSDASMYINETMVLPIECAPWSSVNPFIAEVVDGNILVSHHVGRTILHSADSSFSVSVDPHYTYDPYMEPIITWGASKSQIREWLGTPNGRDGDEYEYYSKDKYVVYSYKFYDKDDAEDDPNRVGLYNSCFNLTSLNKCKNFSVEKAIAILEERYELLENKDNGANILRYYADCYLDEYKENYKNASVVVTLQVSTGFGGILCIDFDKENKIRLSN